MCDLTHRRLYVNAIPHHCHKHSDLGIWNTPYPVFNLLKLISFVKFTYVNITSRMYGTVYGLRIASCFLGGCVRCRLILDYSSPVLFSLLKKNKRKNSDTRGRGQNLYILLIT
jgi:hypothetical protein